MHSAFQPFSIASAILMGALAFGFSQRAQAAFPVIGYYPSWAGDLGSVQYGKLTHINYSFGNTDAAGNISFANPDLLRDLIDRAHTNKVKVGLAIGGWAARTANFSAMAANPTARANFMAQAVALCDEGLDGIDMDWEYPDAGSAGNFALLMKELGTALHAKGKYLSAAVIGQGDYFGQHIRASVLENVDYLNLMAYDEQSQAHHSSYEVGAASLDYWVTRRKLPKHKAVLGVPFYGRSINGGEQYVSYRDIVGSNAAAAQIDVNNGLYYTGIPTMVKKTELAYQKGGGIMIWELSQDATGSNSLLSAIGTKAATFPIVGIRMPGAPASAMGRLVMAGPGLLRFHAPAPGAYSLRLRSLVGARLLGGTLKAGSAGTGDFLFDPAALPAGAYLAEISGGGSTRTLRLLLP